MKRFLIGLSIFAAACETGITHSSDEIHDSTESDSDEVEGSATDEPLEEDEVDDESIPEDDTAEEVVTTIVDFSQRGPHEIVSQSESASVTNCSNMNYSIFSPVGISSPPIVVLGHGFGRGSDTMSGWAEHLSSWGVEVLLPTLCHYNVFFGVDHEMNGQNMVELANHHGADEVTYAGHSAGGLAAIIAASFDSQAQGVLGLDTTDTQDVPGVPDFIGMNYASSVTSKAFSIRGEPSSCNSENNGLTLFRMMSDYKAIKVTSADHCDFERPTDFMCEMNCEGSSSEFTDDVINKAILTLGTAAIIAITEALPDGDLVWTEEELSEWTASGLVQSLEP